MASKPYGVLHVGVTNDLIRRVYEHKHNLIKGFTEKYFVHLLVWFESTNSIETAIKKEKQVKEWKRQWKLELINKSNSQWKDLYSEIIQ
jgi:putative endonuclease